MSEVSDYTALLAINSNDNYRWNSPADLQVGVIVTYSFATSDTIPAANEGSYAVDSYSAFTEAQKANFRDVVDVFEAVAGVTFVEVSTGGMVDIYSASGSGYGGWANYPYASETQVNFGDLVIDNTGDYDEGSFAFTTMLHELGHAMGLEHPHEGEHTLHDDDDHFENTVMTYNIGWGDYPSELGLFDVQALQFIYGDAMNTDGWTFAEGETYFEIQGATNNDEIMGISGANMIKGHDGGDHIWGRDENDKIFGNKGRDVLNGLYGDDHINGGKGNDTIYGSVEGGGVYYYDHDTLLGGSGNDKIYGQAGNDLMKGGSGRDTMDGGDHTDTMYGGSGQDTMDGGSGQDTMYGGSGRDTMLGGGGNDTIDGGKGDDTIDGGTGSNTMTGGTGIDTFIFENASFQVWNRITDYTVGEDTLDFSNTGFASEDVSHFQNGSDTYVKIGSGSDYLIAYLEDFNNADFSVDQMVF